MATRGNYIEEDPFEDLDDSVAITDLEHLMFQVNRSENSYEFVNTNCIVNADSKIPVS